MARPVNQQLHQARREEILVAARAQLASFGSGPRSCVGQQLALTLASLTLAHMMAASVSPASPND